MHDELVSALLRAAPGFAARWEAYLASWKEEEPGDYNAMSEFAHYVVESYATGHTKWFRAFFDTVEQFLCSAIPAVRSILAIGLFEDIQAISSHRPFGDRVFESWLGPKSLEAWREVDENMRRAAEQARSNDTSPGIDVQALLSQVENPELRKMIEALYWRK